MAWDGVGRSEFGKEKRVLEPKTEAHSESAVAQIRSGRLRDRNRWSTHLFFSEWSLTYPDGA